MISALALWKRHKSRTQPRRNGNESGPGKRRGRIELILDWHRCDHDARADAAQQSPQALQQSPQQAAQSSQQQSAQLPPQQSRQQLSSQHWPADAALGGEPTAPGATARPPVEHPNNSASIMALNIKAITFMT